MGEQGHPGRHGVYLVLGLAGFGLAVYFVSFAVIRGQRRRDDVREGERQFTLRGLAEAVRVYHHERGTWPAGDGKGSAGLAADLGKKSGAGMPYLNYSNASLGEDGQLYVPGGGLIHYKCPGEKEPFEIWSDVP